MSGQSCPMSKQYGLSLLELMIALALTLATVAAVSQIYVSNRQAYKVLNSQARLQENARFVLNLLHEEFQVAGYGGCAGRDVRINIALDNDPTSNRYYFYSLGLGDAVYGHDAKMTGPPNAPNAWTPLDVATSVRPDATRRSDIVTIRGPVGAPQVVRDLSSSIVEIDDTGILETGNVALIADCQNGAIFQVTSDTPDAGQIKLGYKGGAATLYPKNRTTVDLTNQGFTKHSLNIVRYDTSIYFVGKDDDGVPGLYRYRSEQEQVAGDPVLLVDNVENMQVRYGEDVDGDLVPDYFRSARQVVNWPNVISIQVALLMRTPEQTRTSPGPRVFDLLDTPVEAWRAQAAPDRYQRQVLKTVISLRNRVN